VQHQGARSVLLDLTVELGRLSCGLALAAVGKSVREGDGEVLMLGKEFMRVRSYNV
jgi:hypothetical protein